MIRKKLEKYYVSTSLPYVNAIPHLGFAFEIIAADVFSRHLRNCGHEVTFITGTDENSFKILRYAKKLGIDPVKLVKQNRKKFFELKKELQLSNDVFFHTASSAHRIGARKFWNSFPKEDLYIDSWSSKYCSDCEAFYNNDSNLVKCPFHLTNLEDVTEQNYFFKLDKYKSKLKDLITSGNLSILPNSQRNHSIKLLNSYENFNVSRVKEGNWGINVPGDKDRVMYAFFEALLGYINAIGFSTDSVLFRRLWSDKRSKVIHFCGRDITKFHTIYFPALLLSHKMRIPSQVVVHGFINKDAKKMSKSMGNTISPIDLVKKYNSDAVRLYLLSHPFFSDFEFNLSELIKFHDKVLLLKSLVKSAELLIGKKTNYSKKIQNTLTKSTQYKLYDEHVRSYKYDSAIKLMFSTGKQLESQIKIIKSKGVKFNQLEKINELYIVLVNMATPFIPGNFEY